jgi:hypothetical protein
MIIALSKDELTLPAWLRRLASLADEPVTRATIQSHPPDWYRLTVNGCLYWVLDVEIGDVLGYLRRENIEVCWV